MTPRKVLRIGWPGDQNTRTGQAHLFSMLKTLYRPWDTKRKKQFLKLYMYIFPINPLVGLYNSLYTTLGGCYVKSSNLQGVEHVTLQHQARARRPEGSADTPTRSPKDPSPHFLSVVCCCGRTVVQLWPTFLPCTLHLQIGVRGYIYTNIYS